MADMVWEETSHRNLPLLDQEVFSALAPLGAYDREGSMYKTEPKMTGGCQCGAVRYALFEMPVSTVCHCRMCQKAVGGLFAALSKVNSSNFVWTKGNPASFQSSTAAERHFCASCGTPLTFHFLVGDEIEVTTGSLDNPAAVPITRNFGTESRMPWIDLLAPGKLPDSRTEETATREVVSHQQPDH